MPSSFISPYWKSINITSSGRPILFDNEHDILILNSVGLYQGDIKLNDYQQGRIYLTNERIIFINDSNCTSTKFKNIALSLLTIKEVQSYKGFLKSSPKVILTLKDSTELTPNNEQAKKGTIDVNWVCPICYYSSSFHTTNYELDQMEKTGAFLPVCQTCGVMASRETIENFINKEDKDIPIDLISFDGSQCPNCTFMNHPSMVNCEMCGTKLTSPHLSSLDAFGVEDNKSSEKLKMKTMQEFQEIDMLTVKLSFRNGGSNVFFEKLQYVLQKAEWIQVQESNGANKGAVKIDRQLLLEDSSSKNLSSKYFDSLQDAVSLPPNPGIYGLTTQTIQQNYEATMLLSNSLQDLHQLNSKAKQLISLSQKYQRILMQTHPVARTVDQNLELLTNSKQSIRILNNILTNNEISKVMNNSKKMSSLMSLKKGKRSNKTKSGMPDLYLDELARQVNEFLTNENILDKNNGLITLYQLFSLYNKARQMNIISPVELYDAMMRIDNLGLNLKLSQVPLHNSLEFSDVSHMSKLNFTEKIFIVSKKNQATSTSKKILEYITKFPGISISQLQHDQLNMSYIILKTFLDRMAFNGDLVIDSTFRGIFYWPNQISSFDSNTVMQFSNETEDNLFKEGALGDVIYSTNDLGITEISKFFKTDTDVNTKESERLQELADLDFHK